MKKIICLALCLLMVLGLCACQSEPEEEVAEPSPTVTAEPEGMDKWLIDAQTKYNMDYSGFAEYWSLMTDRYFGENVEFIVNTVSAKEQAGYSLEEYNEQIDTMRSQYSSAYGTDWCFEIADYTEETLPDEANTDFAAELEEIYDSIAALTGEAESWSDLQWSQFAAGIGCDTETAKQLIDAYAAIGEACHSAQVSKGTQITMDIVLTGKKAPSDNHISRTTCVYEVNGSIVSEELIDSTFALINLVY